MAKVTIEFNRDENTHSLSIDGCNGKEMLIAYQTLESAITEKMGMPIELALLLAGSEKEAKDGKD